MSFSNYQQKVVIDGVALSGVQDVNGSYGISEKPIRIAGVGFVDALVNAPLEGNFTISRKMVSRDPLIQFDSLGKYTYDENEISGAILYENDTKGFGFTKGRVTRYSVNCAVGEIPDIQTDITVYGDLGSGVMTQSETQSHPPIQYPDQSSISINVSDFQLDAITDFSYSRSLNLEAVYAIPKGTSSDWDNDIDISNPNLDPVQIDTQYPIETDINFTMIVNNYQIKEMKDKIRSAPKSNVSIQIKDAETDAIINAFTGQNVRLTSESISSSTEDEMTISLTYKGYETLHNPVS
jgi:hypothetical protein